LIGDVDRYVLLAVCTAIVRPMNSGRIMERRDQVLIGFCLCW
jgi:hypothetical protein